MPDEKARHLLPEAEQETLPEAAEDIVPLGLDPDGHEAEDEAKRPWQAAPDVVAHQRRSVRLLIIAQIFGSFGMGASASVGVLLVQQVIADEALAGAARSALTLGAALLGVPLALIAGRGGRRVSLGLGWFLGAVGAASLVVAAVLSSIPLVIAGMILFGAGTAAGLQTRFSATDLALPAHRGRTLAMVVWTGTLGSVVGPNLGVPGAAVSALLGLPELAGAFLIAAVMLTLAGAILFFGLRPDPLLLAQRMQGLDSPTGPGTSRKRISFRFALATIWRLPRARFAFLAVVLSHMSMVALMTMTPVHMNHEGASLTFIGLTISVHVLGMFALSPVVGWASDRMGPVPVILIGQAIFAGSAVIAITLSFDWLSITSTLFLLGLGWSCATVPGSVLLSASVPPEVRTQTQGTVDTVMNLIAAGAALAAGPVFEFLGYPGLAMGVLLLALTVVTLTQALPADARRWTLRRA